MHGTPRDAEARSSPYQLQQVTICLVHSLKCVVCAIHGAFIGVHQHTQALELPLDLHCIRTGLQLEHSMIVLASYDAINFGLHAESCKFDYIGQNNRWLK